MKFNNFSIIIAGSLGAGKTTGAVYLANKYNYQHLSFVNEIWIPILNERKLEVNRSNLQVLGIELMSRMGPQRIVETLLLRAFSGKTVLIDDVRRRDVVEIIKESCLGVFLIYIDTDFDTRYPRLVIRDNIKGVKEQIDAEAVETETTIPQLKLIADIVINNDGDLNLFYSCLDNAIIEAKNRFCNAV